MKELKEHDKEPITDGDIEKIKTKIKAEIYIPCSAKTTEGVKEVFDECVKCAILRREKPAKKGICNIL
eukprot:EC823005.1.p2 GENE.EC823005.1~~EC823005.1.p2  ORF type:complete len:68 (-),score=28.96 EC823005.1:132-335(-)